MHIVVVKADLAREKPDLVKAVYQGSCDAKRIAVEDNFVRYLLDT